jgi:esterase/lipase
MTTVLLFHHAQGQTTGFLAFADELREAGHTVHAPDLYDGNTFEDLNEGVAYAGQVGFSEIRSRGTAAAEDLPADIVYAGFSLGGLPAQSLAETRIGLPPRRWSRTSRTQNCSSTQVPGIRSPTRV